MSCLSRTAILSWDTLELDTSRRLCSHTLVPSTYLLMGDSKHPTDFFKTLHHTCYAHGYFCHATATVTMLLLPSLLLLFFYCIVQLLQNVEEHLGPKTTIRKLCLPGSGSWIKNTMLMYLGGRQSRDSLATIRPWEALVMGGSRVCYSRWRWSQCVLAPMH